MTTVSDRSTMNPVAQWIVWFGLGASNALLMGIGGAILVVLLVALAVRVASRGDTLSGLSGLFAGFGTTWLALIGRQAGSGGYLDDAGPWVALGVVTLAFGAGLGAWRLVRRTRTALLPR
jgi:hypothetical protein